MSDCALVIVLWNIYLEYLLRFSSLEMEWMIHDSCEIRFKNKNRMTSFFVILGSSETILLNGKNPKLELLLHSPMPSPIRSAPKTCGWFVLGSVFGICSQLHRNKIERSIVINFPITRSSMLIVLWIFGMFFFFLCPFLRLAWNTIEKWLRSPSL